MHNSLSLLPRPFASSRKLLLLTLCAALLALDGRVCRAQALDALRSEVHEPVQSAQVPPASAPPARNDSSPSFSTGDDDDDSWEFFAIVGAVTAPFWAPVAATGDNLFDMKPFLRFPYADKMPGYLIEAPEMDPNGKWWSLQTSLEYDATFDNLQRASGEVLFSTERRFDLDFQGNELWEHRNGQADSLFFGRSNLLYRFAQNEYVQFRTGFGVNWLVDDHSAAGFNFHYGVQVFPIKKLVFNTEIDWGTLGDTTVFHGRLTAGIQHRHAEVYTGFDFQRIGDVDFSGPVIGCRLYF